MKNVKIVINATVANDTDLNALRQRVSDHLRKISSPVREDEGITTVGTVKISAG